MTCDQMAVTIMLDNRLTERQRQAKLTALLHSVQETLGCRCPECGAGKDAVEDNGAAHEADLAYLCRSCGHQWDAVPV
jgi:DNA-directed RNA polymerase subunit RPC12/RpoP